MLFTNIHRYISSYHQQRQFSICPEHGTFQSINSPFERNFWNIPFPELNLSCPRRERERKKKGERKRRKKKGKMRGKKKKKGYFSPVSCPLRTSFINFPPRHGIVVEMRYERKVHGSLWCFLRRASFSWNIKMNDEEEKKEREGKKRRERGRKKRRRERIEWFWLCENS